MYADMPDSNPRSKIRTEIDDNLKRIYDETLKEAIPQKLTDLLEQLQKKMAAPDDSDKQEKS